MLILFSHCQRYLLITITFCFAAGILFSLYCSQIINPLFFTVLIAAATLFLHVLKYSKTAIILSCFGFFALGVFVTDQALNKPLISNDIVNLVNQKKDVVITGTIEKISILHDSSSKILLDVLFFRTKQDVHLIRSSGKVLLTLQGKMDRHILPGDVVTIRVLLKTITQTNTPGIFNYKKFLAHKNIHLTGFISSPVLIEKTLLVSHHPRLPHYIERLRIKISRKLDTLDSPNASGLYKAILLGERSAVSPSVISVFKKTGIMHILAISGLHMALLGFFLYNLIYYCLRCSEKMMLFFNIKKVSMLLCIPCLLLYTCLAGANPPVVRSFLMSIFVIVALFTDRLKSPLTILAGAALLLLIFDPLSIESASFQLSFSAVIFIILLTPKLLALTGLKSDEIKEQTRSTKIRFFISGLIAVTISATIGTVPILIVHFNQISTMTIPANLVVEPLICFWSLPCGFLAIPFMFICPSIADFILSIGSIGLYIAIEASSFLASLPYSTLWPPDPPFVIIVIYYISIVSIIIFNSSVVKKIMLLLAIASISVFFIPLTPLPYFLRSKSTISFLDVGQGSSSLLELSGGKTILIDGGALGAPGFNCGERIIAPFIWHRGIGRLSDIIVTHADADHYNGLSVLFEKFKPARLWLPHGATDKADFLSMIEEARKQKVQILYPVYESIFSDEKSDLDIIDFPKNRDKSGALQNHYGTSYNDNGLVIRLKTNGYSFLFPGDISSAKELKLVQMGAGLDADVLLSPHHGSSTSNSRQFLTMVSPEYLVVSSADRTGRYFPSIKTVEHAEKIGAKLLTTVKNGTITFSVDKNGLQLDCFQTIYKSRI